ncbi:MAG TPA: amino acid deaminase [Acetobacteraceae bacterium]
MNEIGATILDGRTKGMPGGIEPFPLDAIGRKGWNLLNEDLPLPLAVLKDSALRHNSAWMRDFLRRSRVDIAPHGKTTMAPQLFRRQMEDGAWAITLATAHQLAVARDQGFDRIILANQLIGRQMIRYVLDELRAHPEFEFFCIVDSLANVAQLAEAARAAQIGRPLQVFLEGGLPNGRTGVRDRDTGLAVARAVKAAEPFLALRGVEGFEGLTSGTRAEAEAQVRGFLDLLVGLAHACEAEDLFAPGEVILTAGGSAFYDMVIARLLHAGLSRPTRVITRSGCYLSHDSVSYRRFFADIVDRTPEAAQGGGLIPALEVWAYVQSRPQPDKVLLTMGKRDVGVDDMPVAQTWFRPGTNGPVPIPPGHMVIGHNDQHCHMTVPPDSPLAVGDMVSFGVSHPCLTFDKWQVIPVVDDEYRVVSAIKTFF